MNADLPDAAIIENLVRNRIAELLRTNERLRDECRVLRSKSEQLSNVVMDLHAGKKSDRDARLATLSLLEDVEAARTAEAKKGEQYRRAEEELRRLNRSKDEFIATLAHELRNPLAPICNTLRSLHTTTPEDDPRSRLLTVMERQISHVARLVDDLLEISRINAGKFELREEPLILQDVIQAAVELSGPQLKSGNRIFELSLPSDPVTLLGDRVRIIQMVANLLNNAVRYTDTGGHIQLRAFCYEKKLFISVQDNGIGIAPEMLTRIFDLFTQGDRRYSSVREGLGVGLTLARRIAELHGGVIEAHSEGPGHGSEFVVQLPLPVHQIALPQFHQHPEQPGAAQVRSILVVDDNQDAAESMALLLRLQGFEVEMAENGRTALAMLGAQPPDILFIDIGLPDIDGMEVTRQVRAAPYGRDLTIIAVTGWGQPEDRRRSAEAGVNYHLLKPVDFDALMALLRSLPNRTDPPR